MSSVTPKRKQKTIYDNAPKNNAKAKFNARLTRKHTAAIQKEAALIRKNDFNILCSPNPFRRFFRIKNKKRKEIIPEIEVAKASPPILSGNINSAFKIIFKPKARPAIFVGVTVSLRAKKQDCNIFEPP